jgi:anti-sigma-K factor RskA
MNCDQAEELLGAYALDALPEGEAAEMRAHLRTCETHAAKARELVAVASQLHTTVEPATPPAALGNRIAAAVAATPQGGTISSPTRTLSHEPARLEERRIRTANRLQWRPAFAFGALAAALAIAVAGLLAWNINLRNDSGSADVFAVRPLAQDTGATAGYVVLYDDGSAAVIGESLPRLDASQTYQLWSLSPEGEATSLGLMDYDDAGVATSSVDDIAAGSTAVAITIEPAGRSDQPTSAPLYIAEL